MMMEKEVVVKPLMEVVMVVEVRIPLTEKMKVEEMEVAAGIQRVVEMAKAGMVVAEMDEAVRIWAEVVVDGDGGEGNKRERKGSNKVILYPLLVLVQSHVLGG